MLGQNCRRNQKNFSFDHIGIRHIWITGTKEIEIKAEAGATAHAMGRRIPLGMILGAGSAHSGDAALVQTALQARWAAILPESRSLVCVFRLLRETLLGARI